MPSNPLGHQHARGLQPRQTQPSEADYPSCDFVNADVQTCYPQADTVIYQNHFTRIIWNPRYTAFVGDDGEGQVDLILKNADSDRTVGNWSQPNRAGVFKLPVDDMWWDARAIDNWRGEPQNWSFYWQIVPSTHVWNGGEARQPTFTVIQTALPNSALSSSSASVVSQSLASASRSLEAEASQASRDAQLQNRDDNNNFPAWAIALVVVLGVVALVSILSLVFVLTRQSRRKRGPDRRDSMGSESPMLEATTTSPTTAGHSTTTAGIHPPATLPPPLRHAPSNTIKPLDGASINSRTNSAGEPVITTSDAAIMADAFRKALRKPDFADRPHEEGESPDRDPPPSVNTGAKVTNPEAERLLKEEGRDIRSVSSERGVKVVNDG